ncbi:MAG: hypothetical protein ACNFW9_05140 [Candidatus Kerfeldbacteria bacterium]|jgi:type IV secretion system pilin
MKKKTFLIALIIINVVIFIVPTLVFAQTLPNPITGGNDKVDVVTIMLRVMQIALAVVDIFALFMFILGGFEFLISAGNPERVKKAKDTLVWATVGILVITLSYTILKYIFEQVSKGFGA